MKKLFFLIFTVVFFSCATMKVSYDYDRDASFDKYKTYQLSEESQNLAIQQLNRDRVIKAVENEMLAKGLSKSDFPDVIVDVVVVGKQIQTATATTSGDYGYGYRRYGYGGGFSTTHITYDQYTEGTMVISFIDATVNKIVWQGTGTKTLLEDVKPEKRESNINYSVQEIMKNYPPIK